MPVRIDIIQNEFDKMLKWLDPDPEAAGHRYESIRHRLIKFFCARGCSIAEELADETIDRVTKKIEWLAEFFEGEPSRYFLGVARNVFHEYSKTPKFEELPAGLTREVEIDDLETHHECLNKCLDRLPVRQYELILGYYEGTKRAKIDGRKKLVELLGITSQTLRVRALRLRVSLQKCVLLCVERNFGETF